MIFGKTSGKYSMILSMIIFSTIGILRRHIPYSSDVVALIRGLIGTAFLLLLLLLQKQTFPRDELRKNLILLILSGAAIGFNWMLLFEAYNYTSVAAATLCYYLAPTLVILLSPIVLREQLTARKLLCAFCALIGIVLVSGVTEAGVLPGNQNLKGILLGLGAAGLYSSVILMNKKMSPMPPLVRTVTQLAAASATLLPYVIASHDPGAFTIDPGAAVLLAVAGIVHTGIAYALYFSSVEKLKANTIALLSYIDPVLAVVLSLVILREPMTVSAVIGAVLILGASFFSE